MLKRLFLVVVSILICSCSSSPPISIFVEPGFDGRAVLSGPTAFLLPEQIEVKAIVSDIIESGRKPAVWIGEFNESLAATLEGQIPVSVTEILFWDKKVSFNFQNVADVAAIDTLRSQISMSEDENGVVFLSVEDASKLEMTLGEADVRYLVAFSDVVMSKEQSGAGKNLGGPTTDAKHWNDYWATCFCFVWDRQFEKILWHGVLKAYSSNEPSGKSLGHEIGGKLHSALKSL